MKTFQLYIKQDEHSKEVASLVKTMLLRHFKQSKSPDVVISIGGDGTMLQAIHHYQFCSKLLFIGIHTGTLGFLTSYLESQIEDLILKMKEDDFDIEDHALLEIEAKTSDHTKQYFAVNECRLESNYFTSVVDVFVDDTLLETFRGNGLCVATSIGSTAYNKSLNGAIVDPLMKTMQLTEIAGIHHNAYRSLGSPLILSDQRVLKFILKKMDPQQAIIGVDHLVSPLSDVLEVRVSLSKRTIKMIDLTSVGYFEKLKRAYIKDEDDI